MKKLVLALVGLLASTLLPSYGAPTCSWTSFSGGNCTTNSAGYVLDLNGNTVSSDGSSVTIGDNPIKVHYFEDKNMSGNISIIVQCTLPDNQAGAIVSYELSNNNYITAYWDGASKLDQRNNTTTGYGTSDNLLTKPQNLMLTYRYGTGTDTFVDGHAAISDTVLKWSAGSAKTAYIGNSSASGSYLLEGMVVTGIYLYVGTAQTTWPTSDLDIGPTTDFESFAINFGAGQASVDTTSTESITFGDSDKGGTVALSTWNNITGYSGTAYVTGSDNTHYHELTVSATAETNSGTTLNSPTEIQNLTYGALSAATITLADMPTTGYDVAVIFSGTGSAGTFNPVTVNNVSYTYANSATTEGTDTWGDTSADGTTLTEGSNVLYVSAQTSSTLTISATSPIAGIIVYPKEATSTTYTASVTSNSNYSGLTWDNNTSAPSSTSTSYAQITVTDGVTLTIDSVVKAKQVDFICDGSFTLVIADGCDFSDATTVTSSGVTGNVIWGSTVDSLISNTNFTYAAGAGSSTTAASLTLNGGTLPLTGGTFYYSTFADDSTSGTATTVELSNEAKIAIADTTDSGGQFFRVGMATYILKDEASIEAQRFFLSDGQASRTSIFTMSNNSSVVVSGRSGYGSVNSTEADVLFGHWNGPSTFTMEDNSTFTASSSDVLVAWTGNTQEINLNGGTMTVQGIMASGGRGSGTATLNLAGGTLNVGSTGLGTYGGNSITLDVNVTGSSTIGTTSTSTLATPISSDIAFSNSATLTISNANYSAAADETAKAAVATNIVNMAGDLTGTGTITIGPKVNLVLTSTSRPDSTVTLDMTDSDATLAIYLESNAETPSFTITGTDVTDRITVYGEDGTVSTTATITASGDDSTVYTISSGMKVFNANNSTVALATATQWDNESVATDNEDFEIKLSTDATLDVTSSYTYGTVYVTSTDSTSHTLTISADFPASKLDLGDNVVLAFANLTSGTTLSNTIRGTGSVTYSAGQSVVIAADNYYTGTTTIESGSVISLDVAASYPLGYGATMSGAGQVVITNGAFVARGSAPTNPLGVTFTGTTWTGTVTLRGFAAGSIYQNYSVLANSGSVLEIDGVAGYYQPSSTTTAKEIKISNTAGSGSGYGINVINGDSGSYAIFQGKLTGAGPIRMINNTPQFCLSFVGDCTGWTGNMVVTNNFRLFFATTTAGYTTDKDTALFNGYTYVGTAVNVKTWAMDPNKGSVAVTDTGVLNVTSASTVTASNITFNAGATISATSTTTSTPATFTAALEANGAVTITGGSVKATSAVAVTAAGTDTFVLADTAAELILDTEADEGLIVPSDDLAAENYYVGCSKSSSTYRYFLRKPAFILSIR